MKKDQIFLIVIAFLILGVGAVWFFTSKTFERLTTSSKEKELTVDEQEDVLEKAFSDYSKADGTRAEGNVEFQSNGRTYNADINAKTTGQSRYFLEIEIEGETLQFYTEKEDNQENIYVSNGEDTAKFELQEDSDAYSVYSEVNETDPNNMIEDLDEKSQEEDVEVEYKGIDNCREMKCHKYIITDNSGSATVVTILWLDTDEKLPQMLDTESPDFNGEFDFYYDDYNFSMPESYEEIKPDSISGIQKLYNIMGDFVNLFL
ncbi:hypothetical protein JW710_00615 [Candidatus Dojkabacteria bacterium]|nr:hypothetical protein [Candidatus Dojkabacteria bacterium]